MRSAVEKFRVKSGEWKSNEGDSHGLFFIPLIGKNETLKVISSPFDSDWQHVSVSIGGRCPLWSEMCLVKNLFWGEDKTVIQFHPKKSEYVNNHPYCLHLWAKKDSDFELPPSILVGLK